ncbi:MAG TPA: HAD family hydrolase [Verrucomicrobiae bacterium]|nr:HAD family hydrolase [Verrucomicrobiae bacterium]
MNPPCLLRSDYWIFDLDGTLTVPVHDFAAIRQELGIPDGGDILEHVASAPAESAVLMRERLRLIEDELALRTRPAEGALALLQALRRNGARMGVLTRNTREVALRTLELIGAADCFPEQDVLGRDEARPKPDPDGILALAGRWGADPAATVMVGDYLYDLQAGRRAGATTVHVERGPVPRWPELADVVVAGLDELAMLVAAVQGEPAAVQG